MLNVVVRRDRHVLTSPFSSLFDVVYVTWAVHLLSIFSDSAWYLYVLVST